MGLSRPSSDLHADSARFHCCRPCRRYGGRGSCPFADGSARGRGVGCRAHFGFGGGAASASASAQIAPSGGAPRQRCRNLPGRGIPGPAPRCASRNSAAARRNDPCACSGGRCGRRNKLARAGRRRGGRSSRDHGRRSAGWERGDHREDGSGSGACGRSSSRACARIRYQDAGQEARHRARWARDTLDRATTRDRMLSYARTAGTAIQLKILTINIAASRSLARGLVPCVGAWGCGQSSDKRLATARY